MLNSTKYRVFYCETNHRMTHVRVLAARDSCVFFNTRITNTRADNHADNHGYDGGEAQTKRENKKAGGFG